LADSSKSISSLKKLLKADVVLTGQLQQIGGVYYISCQLVDASSQNQIWGNKYQMTGDDISQIEDSIINSLMNPLRITLLDRSKGIQQNKPVNPQAYAEYLKGRYLSYGSTPEESEKALSHFRNPFALIQNMQRLTQLLLTKKLCKAFFQQLLKKKSLTKQELLLKRLRHLTQACRKSIHLKVL
jgi:TolB-like protein